MGVWPCRASGRDVSRQSGKRCRLSLSVVLQLPSHQTTFSHKPKTPICLLSLSHSFSLSSLSFMPISKPWRVIPSKNPRVASSVTAAKAFTSNNPTNWFGRDTASSSQFWVPSKRAIDGSDMRKAAAKDFPSSEAEYGDAEMYSCGELPVQTAPPKRATGQLHPPDLVDAEDAASLVQTARKKGATFGGKEVESWDGTVRDVVSAKLWRVRESVK